MLEVWDSDSHLMEVPGWLESYAPGPLRTVLAEKIDFERVQLAARAPARSITGTNWGALGCALGDERSRALDQLGYGLQVVFPTHALTQFQDSSDVDVVYGGAEAYARGISEFCSADRRLVPVPYIPLIDPPRATKMLARLLDDDVKMVLVDTIPREISPLDPALIPFWTMLNDSCVGVALHISVRGKANTGWDPIPPAFRLRSGAPRSEIWREKALEYTILHQPAMTLLSYLIFNGHFERYPNLRVACVEHSGTWLLTWRHYLDSSYLAYRRRSGGGKGLDRMPFEYVRDHVRFSLLPHEPVGQLIETLGCNLFMFSSDYPHEEGRAIGVEQLEQTLSSGCLPEHLEPFVKGNLEFVLRPAA